MVRQVSLLLLIMYFNLIGIGTMSSVMLDDVDPHHLIEWRTFSMLVCMKPSTISVALFECELPINYLEDFDEDVCYMTTTQSIEFTTQTAKRLLPTYECPDTNNMGMYCNITNDICILYAPCKNDGICHSDESAPLKYRCQCPSEEYSGHDCEDDNRICKNNTCWHDGDCISEIVTTNKATTFDCICKHGYDGSHCQLVSDMCANITCENQGVCVSSYLAWKCQCPNTELYSGIYCEHKSSALVVKEIIGKSFASITIAAIAGVFLFVIVMDVLKYGFGIDWVERERQLMKSEREEKRANKGKKEEKCAKVAIKFLYKNASK